MLSVDFIVCVGPVVPFENHVKNHGKCMYHWRKLGGLGTQIRQFCLFYVNFQKVCLTNAKTLAANECVELILILTLLGQTLKLTHVKIL